MPAFNGCKNLTYLNLHATQAKDEGVVHFKNCKDLKHLNLAGTQVSNAGLAAFKDCKNLEYVCLDGTQISDDGLAHFKDCNKLKSSGLAARKCAARACLNASTSGYRSSGSRLSAL